MRRAYAFTLLLAVLLVAQQAAAGSAALTDPEEIAAKQEVVDRHLLRVQQERFEADARADDPRRLKRLEREFRRTQVRRSELKRAAERAERAD